MKKSIARAGHEIISGAHLVADFQIAVTNLVTMETAKLAADQSEEATMRSLESVTNGQQAYLSPQDIPAASQDSIVRASVDAHIKKVQANEISAYTTAQVTELEKDDRRKYSRHKVRVNVIDPNKQSIQSVWFNNKTGQYNNGVIKSKTIKGIIDDVIFEKNLLILRPTLISRTLLPSRKYYFVSVINTQTMEPAVELTLI